MLHEHVEALTVESPACMFCLVVGGREEGLLHGFVSGARASADAVVLLCDAHRIRLSFVFYLHDRVKEAFPPLVPSRDVTPAEAIQIVKSAVEKAEGKNR